MKNTITALSSLISVLPLQFSMVHTSSAASLFFVLLFFIPTGIVLYHWLGIKHTSVFLLGFGSLFIIVEGIAILTGYPYGQFSYSGKLGYKIVGLVPWSLPFSYFPVLLGSVAVSYNLFGREPSKFIGGTVVINVGLDLVLDPAAVAIGFWQWNGSGRYYGVPLINFLGWALTSFVYAFLIYYFVFLQLGKKQVTMRLTYSLFLTLSFFTSYLFLKQIFVPAVLGCFYIGLLFFLYYRR